MEVISRRYKWGRLGGQRRQADGNDDTAATSHIYVARSLRLRNGGRSGAGRNIAPVYGDYAPVLAKRSQSFRLADGLAAD